MRARVHQWVTLGHMDTARVERTARRRRVNVRVGDAGYDAVRAMAGALSTDAVTVTASDVVRTLLAEALGGRRRDCGRGHVGPVAGGVCGHCGRLV